MWMEKHWWQEGELTVFIWHSPTMKQVTPHFNPITPTHALSTKKKSKWMAKELSNWNGTSREGFCYHLYLRFWSPHSLKIVVFLCLFIWIYSARAIQLTNVMIKSKKVNPFGKWKKSLKFNWVYLLLKLRQNIVM